MGSEVAFDVTVAEFDRRVLKAPPERVVVVDFWAPWCDACRYVSPMLEKVVSSTDGAAVLARVNIDESPGLAERYEIIGIPAAKVFRSGKIVAEFVGANLEEEVQQLLRPWLPSKADGLVADADALLEEGGVSMASDLYAAALREEPNHMGAALGLARIHLHRGQIDRAEALAKSIGEGAREHDGAQALLEQIALARQAQGEITG